MNTHLSSSIPEGSAMRKPSMKPTHKRPARIVPVILPMPPTMTMTREVYRLQKIEIRRVEKGVEVRVEPPGNTSQKTAVAEGHRLHPSRIDAEGGRNKLVVLDALPEKPVPREDEVSRHHNQEDQTTKTSSRFIILGMPMNPLDPPTTSAALSELSRSTRTSMPKPSVAMARKSSRSRSMGRPIR